MFTKYVLCVNVCARNPRRYCVHSRCINSRYTLHIHFQRIIRITRITERISPVTYWKIIRVFPVSPIAFMHRLFNERTFDVRRPIRKVPHCYGGAYGCESENFGGGLRQELRVGKTHPIRKHPKAPRTNRFLYIRAYSVSSESFPLRTLNASIRALSASTSVAFASFVSTSTLSVNIPLI